MVEHKSRRRRGILRIQHRKRALLLVPLSVAGVVLLAGAVAVTLQAHTLKVPLDVVPVPITPLTTQVHPLAWPDYGQSAVATRQHGVVASAGPTDKPHPTASLAKVITMIAVLEKKPLEASQPGPILMTTQADVDSHAAYIARNGSNTPVQVGLQLTQYQAIQSVLLASSNNMADTLAIWAFGSIENYQAYANDMLKGWGLTDTVVGGDASGLSPLTISTASDLAQIALKALDVPVLKEIVSQQSADIPGAGTIANTNRLLVNDEIVGMKTGETVEAGGNFILVGTQSQGDTSQQIVVVVMGAPLAPVAMMSSYDLFKSAKQNFSYTTIIQEGQLVAQVVVPWLDDRVDIITSKSLEGWVWSEHLPAIKYLSPATLTASAAGVKDLASGSLLVDYGGGGPTDTVSTRIAQPIQPPTFAWRLGRAVDSVFTN